MSRPLAALFFSAAAIWIASSGVDWRYIPWGGVTAPLVFAIAVAETLAAFALLIAALRTTGGGRSSLLWHCLAIAACMVLEVIFWRIAVEDHGMLLRQSLAVVLSPAPLAAAGLLLWIKPAPPEPSRHLTIYSAGAIGAGIVVLVALYMIRQAPFRESGVYGETYEMLQTMLFAVGLLSGLTGIAAAAVARMKEPA